MVRFRVTAGFRMMARFRFRVRMRVRMMARFRVKGEVYGDSVV